MFPFFTNEPVKKKNYKEENNEDFLMKKHLVYILFKLKRDLVHFLIFNHLPILFYVYF